MGNAIHEGTQPGGIQPQATGAALGQFERIDQPQIEIQPVLMIDQRIGQRVGKLRFAVRRCVVMLDESRRIPFNEHVAGGVP